MTKLVKNGDNPILPPILVYPLKFPKPSFQLTSTINGAPLLPPSDAGALAVSLFLSLRCNGIAVARCRKLAAAAHQKVAAAVSSSLK